MRIFISGSIVLLFALTDLNGQFDQSLRRGENAVQCVLTVENTKWTKDANTGLRVRLRNLSDVPRELSVFPIFYLEAKREKRWQRDYWGPADITADAPAPVDRKVEEGSLFISPKRQSVRLEAKGEAEFSLHAANFRWNARISSVWPDHHLFKCVTRGQYSVYLELNETLRSNKVAVSVEPDSR